MAINTAQERRQYKRIRKNFVARFCIRNDKSNNGIQENWGMVTTHNLSAGGVLFNYDKDIPEGSIIDMLINFPQIKNPVNCTAKVLRIDKTSPSSLLRIAANFIEISHEDQQQINRAAEEFYSKLSGRIEP
jgi:c-di-GMP-binding flagellar brake protein YcgR